MAQIRLFRRIYPCRLRVFSSKEKGQHLFVEPCASLKPAVKDVMAEINHNLEEFVPFNQALYSDLLPDWQSAIQGIKVLLAVSCPLRTTPW